MNAQDKSNQDRKIIKAVDNSLKKYKKTYQLLDEYDKSPQTTPKYEVELRALQKTLQHLPD